LDEIGGGPKDTTKALVSRKCKFKKYEFNGKLYYILEKNESKSFHCKVKIFKHRKIILIIMERIKRKERTRHQKRPKDKVLTLWNRSENLKLLKIDTCLIQIKREKSIRHERRNQVQHVNSLEQIRVHPSILITIILYNMTNFEILKVQSTCPMKL